MAQTLENCTGHSNARKALRIEDVFRISQMRRLRRLIEAVDEYTGEDPLQPWLELLQSNNISGPIPPELGRLSKLHTLDLSNNFLTGEIPISLDHLKSLQYLLLNNNSLSGAFPLSLANMTQLALNLSYNNLSGPIPRFPAKTFDIVGNPLICAKGSEHDCHGTMPMPLSLPLNSSQILPIIVLILTSNSRCFLRRSTFRKIQKSQSCPCLRVQPGVHLPTYSWIWASSLVEA
ncbi:hypothetical protein HHK36_002717 [Tetracentron sinense]|uniref:Uncharacterized protein n=1 Tax=Tetracentron sinense TaxID=13715 RepID=A0A834ZMP1_TETSI|nr:hypothetical protein HHK36_002717 [Tetracentron sinense]